MEKKADIIKSLSPRMKAALNQMAASKQPCTSTSIGSMLTGRQSAHGWQTSAREGGRTLKALERRKLVRLLGYDSVQKIWPWKITGLGKKAVQSLATVAPVPAASSPPAADQACSHCGTKLDDEDRELILHLGPMTCPRCNREGCHECLPFGRGVICPGCEELREAMLSC